MVVDSSSLIFGKDLRLIEVRRLLRSDGLVQIKLPQDVLSETMQKPRKQTLLYQYIKRNFSLPVGRGMFTLCSINPLLTQKMEIPELSETGRWPPRDAHVKLDHAFLSGLTGFDPDFDPDSFANWPNCHNRCAQGLRCYMKMADGKPHEKYFKTRINASEKLLSKFRKRSAKVIRFQLLQ